MYSDAEESVLADGDGTAPALGLDELTTLLVFESPWFREPEPETWETDLFHETTEWALAPIPYSEAMTPGEEVFLRVRVRGTAETILQIARRGRSRHWRREEVASVALRATDAQLRAFGVRDVLRAVRSGLFTHLVRLPRIRGALLEMSTLNIRAAMINWEVEEFMHAMTDGGSATARGRAIRARHRELDRQYLRPLRVDEPLLALVRRAARKRVTLSIHAGKLAPRDQKAAEEGMKAELLVAAATNCNALLFYTGRDGLARWSGPRLLDLLKREWTAEKDPESLDRMSPGGPTLAASIAWPGEPDADELMAREVRRLAALEELGSLECLSGREREMVRLSLGLDLDAGQWGGREHRRRLVPAGYGISQPGLLKMWRRVKAKLGQAS